MKKEERIQLQICQWLKIQYPQLIFFCDIASGMKLSIGQSVKAAKMRSSRGLPDLFIAKRSKQGEYSGLFLELKSTNIYQKKNGELLSNPHLKEQQEILIRLRTFGYKAEFAVGFSEAKKIIEIYLNLNQNTH